MKIGILTQPLHWNYGGIIQNWALQQTLRRLGHEPETISLNGLSRPHRKLLVMRCLSLVKCMAQKYLLRRRGVYLYSVLDPMYYPAAPKYADVMFVKRICKTRTLTADMNLTKYTGKSRYDAFIVGSDQVWREDYSPNILSYFLDFLPENDKRKRIAYAASFGKAKDYISDEKMPECRCLLNRFDAVSVRENEGVSIVRNDFGRSQVLKVLDPTLLLTVNDYESIIQQNDRRSTPYIASYILDQSEDILKILKHISEDRHKPVNQIDIKQKPDAMATISQWLANFADADFVVTDSFHGCVFSIIFGKPFIAIANAERGLDRFVSLLGEFGLSDRLIDGYDAFLIRKEQLLSVTDYAPVQARHEKLREVSLKFLTDALS